VSSLSLTGRRQVLADLVPGTLARDLALVAGGALLTGAAAQLVIPVPGSPVPMTGQTFAALLVGASLGMRRGAASMLLYLLVGAAGVPWFQGATGFDLATAFDKGVTPFLIGDALKTLVAAGVLPLAWAAVSHLGKEHSRKED
jgi:biotin transporter BioY